MQMTSTENPLDRGKLPGRPFFTCESDAFLILDQDALGAGLMKGNLEPWFRFEVGPDNLFETRPLQVTDHSEAKVTVECEGSVVELDLESGAAQRQTPDGARWVYYGGMVEANSGEGWMPFSGASMVVDQNLWSMR
jgi:hypothetical protein